MFQTTFVDKIKHTFYSQKPFPKNHAVYEIICKNMVQPDRPQMTIYYGACWINMATDTHSEYVIFINSPKQQWLGDRATMLRLYIHCLYC
jgi:hypothetical protein